MKINDLKLLSALFQEPNLTKISQRFYLSQSALSKTIRRIEDELGFRLFDRKGFQGLKPTVQGELLAERIQKFSRSWDDTISLVKNFEQKRAELKVTGPALYMRNVFLPRWFASELPAQYRLSYVQSRLDQISLSAQSSDVDIVVTNMPTELPDWIPSPVFAERFAIFSSQKGPVKTLKDLRILEKDWIGYRSSNDNLQHFFIEHQIPFAKITAYIDDAESTLDAIRGNPRLLALLPAHAKHTHKDLKLWLLSDSHSGHQLYLMHRREDPKAKTVSAALRPLLST